MDMHLQTGDSLEPDPADVPGDDSDSRPGKPIIDRPPGMAGSFNAPRRNRNKESYLGKSMTDDAAGKERQYDDFRKYYKR